MPHVHADSAAAGLPLEGRAIVVTRAADQAAGLAAPLQALGAEVLLMPVIDIAPPSDWAPADAAIEALADYDWIVLTSVNGVDTLAERLRVHGLRIEDLSGKRIAAVGSATAAHLRELGIEPAIVPGSFRAEGLVAAFAEIGAAPGARVLVARAEEAREVLPDELRALDFEVDVVPVYRVVAAPAPEDVLDRFRDETIDAVTFASGGTARRFVEALAAAGMDAAKVTVGPIAASIGPVTSEALHELGIAVDVEATEATAESLVQALVDRFTAASQ